MRVWSHRVLAPIGRVILRFLDLIGLVELPQVTPEAQVARLRLHHAELRQLLTANSAFLNSVADLEDRRITGELLGCRYLERQILQACVDVFRVVRSLEVISGQRYPELRVACDRITGRLSDILRERATARTVPSALVLDLGEIDRRHDELVGEKMANLGEVRNRLGLPVPDGFAVTTEAFQRLLGGADTEAEGEHGAGIAPEHPNFIPASPFGPEAEARRASRIRGATLPADLEQCILAAYDRLCDSATGTVPVAVRSSALGEDSHFSFAGQFLTRLGVTRERLLDAYREVTASLYSPEAAHYRRIHKIPLDFAVMGVGVVRIVDASASGVIFTVNPSKPEAGQLLIHAVRGLGVTLADGECIPEILVICREGEPRVLSRAFARQPFKVVVSQERGTRAKPVSAGHAQEPIVGDEEALALARWALRIEEHFGRPQDIEWAMDHDRKPYVLQSRPLRLAASWAPDARSFVGHTVLLQGGDVAFPGVGAGPAVHMDENADLGSFPDGAVLVAPRSSPKFVKVMGKARAIVVDAGSTTGHMASLAREFCVPTLLGTGEATRSIPAGRVVTVDSRAGLVYDGEVPDLIEAAASAGAASATTGAESPSHRAARELLDAVGELLLPLSLTDPRSGGFRPDQCRTLHDIARFAHEKCYEEMFRKGEDLGDLRSASYFLDVFLPIDLYIIDLGGGLAPGVRGRRVKPSQVASVPLKALLKGMLDRRIQRFGARPMDMAGFVSIVLRHALTSPERKQTFHDPSYVLASDRYLNYTARVGYHFGVVDSYCGKTANKNYISMHFRGGAADLVRRGRRARAISGILRANGFQVGIDGDAVRARLSKSPQAVICEKLEMLGRLLQYVRQMDIALVSEGAMAAFERAFLAGDFEAMNPRRRRPAG